MTHTEKTRKEVWQTLLYMKTKNPTDEGLRSLIEFSGLSSQDTIVIKAQRMNKTLGYIIHVTGNECKESLATWASVEDVIAASMQN